MTRVGVIGAGLMGSIHARLLASDVPGRELVAVADPDLRRGRARSGRRPRTRTAWS